MEEINSRYREIKIGFVRSARVGIVEVWKLGGNSEDYRATKVEKIEASSRGNLTPTRSVRRKCCKEVDGGLIDNIFGKVFFDSLLIRAISNVLVFTLFSNFSLIC